MSGIRKALGLLSAYLFSLAHCGSESFPSDGSFFYGDAGGGGSDQAMDHQHQHQQQRNRMLAECETVEVTGGYNTTPGLYNDEGTRNGKLLFVSFDRSWELFYSERSEDDSGDRRRWRDRRRLHGGGVEVQDEEKQVDATVGDGFGDISKQRRRLGACDGGYWSLAPAGARYPRFTVSDCASHPADIKVSTWLQVACESCEEKSFNGATPGVDCFEGEESTFYSSGSGETDDSKNDDGENADDGDGGDDGDDDGGDGDNAAADDDDAAAADDDASGDADGGISEGFSSSSGATTGACKVLDVGGKYPGLYTLVGTYNSRGDFYSQDLGHNIFFELQATSTSGDDNDDGNDDDGDDDDDGDGDGGNRRRLLGGLFGETSEKSLGKGESSRSLASCNSGYWIKMPTGGGYPFAAVADCATNPQNIAAASSEWIIVTCKGCNPTAMTWPQRIDCATGDDAFFATPAPVPKVEVGSAVESIPGAGATSCEKVTVTGGRQGGYTVTGELNSRSDLLSDDGLYRFFFTGPAPALLSYGVDDDDVSLPGGSSSCVGYWYIVPSDGRYPAYALADCAYHPADITSTAWLYIRCENCEVTEVVEPGDKPQASCTGASEKWKRGASMSTPAPSAFNSSGSDQPTAASSLTSTCTDLHITGDLAGNYSSNDTYRGKPDFFSDDGDFNLYFELTGSRRSLATATESGDRRGHPGEDMTSALRKAYGVLDQGLAVCSSGYWVLAPVAGGEYPVFGVPDCSDHPADIRSSAWLVVTCFGCEVQEAPSFVAPIVSCASSSGAADAGGEGDVDGVTPAPAAAASCDTVYVNGPVAGVYTSRGLYGGRPDFQSKNAAWNLYWVFYAGKPEQSSRRRSRDRRSLYMSDGVGVFGVEGDERWSQEHELALQALAEGFDAAGFDAAGLEDEFEDRSGEGPSGAVALRRLEYCDDGFWLVTPRGGGFPFYGTKNCAEHPADIPTDVPWSTVECDGCGSNPTNDTFSFDCDGQGFTPPPSPTAVATPRPGIEGDLNGVSAAPANETPGASGAAAIVAVAGGKAGPGGGFAPVAAVGYAVVAAIAVSVAASLA